MPMVTPKIALLLFPCLLPAQIMVSMELVPTKGASPQIGKGLSAYPWNIHVCPLGPTPVPWDVVRFNFPEVRFYDLDQQASILSARVEKSAPAMVATYLGYGASAAGLAVQIRATLNKSPSQLGNALSVGGIIIPVLIQMFTKATPNYTIVNPVPALLTPSPGCNDYTNLAASGKASVTIGPRRINPLSTSTVTASIDDITKEDWEHSYGLTETLNQALAASNGWPNVEVH